MPGIFKNPNQPPADYRVWIDGTYKDGIIGYGVLIQPGYKQISGGDYGENTREATFKALELALADIPENSEVIVYSNYKPLIRQLQKPAESEKRNLTLRPQYTNDRDAQFEEARRLATKGRDEAAMTRRARRP